MLDLDFMRHLGIKDELLPSKPPERLPVVLPQAGKSNIPPELGRPDDLALMQLLKEFCRQHGLYKFKSLEGLVVAIYPHIAAAEGRYDIEMTITQFMGLMKVTKVFKRLRFYRSVEEMDGV